MFVQAMHSETFFRTIRICTQADARAPVKKVHLTHFGDRDQVQRGALSRYGPTGGSVQRHPTSSEPIGAVAAVSACTAPDRGLDTATAAA